MGKHEVISFKADESLHQALKDIPNRSEFIRSAIQAALTGVCPLCQGKGVLSSKQIKHWQEFIQEHELTECKECHALHLVCRVESHPPACEA
ncbi:MAG: ribbon-helix-helix domain-containing protein [Desulfarculaceae bacterium]|jgi:hypothetical protein